MLKLAAIIAPRSNSSSAPRNEKQHAGNTIPTAHDRSDVQINSGSLQRIYIAESLSSAPLLTLTPAETRFKDIQCENAALRANIEVLTDALAEAAARNTEAHRLAHHDALTGLPNRLFLKERMQHDLTAAILLQKQLALLFIDLDGFKNVNDSYGHTVGDKLLTAAAGRIAGCIRADDIACRYSGDEFVVLLSNVSSPAIATYIGEKIRDHIRQRYGIDGHDCYVTASVGIALYPNDGEDYDALLGAADTSMYRDKATQHKLDEPVMLTKRRSPFDKFIQCLQKR